MTGVTQLSIGQKAVLTATPDFVRPISLACSVFADLVA